MSFGGYNPSGGGSSELPFTSNTRSRASSISSVHSNHGQQQQQQQHPPPTQSPYQSPYSSQPGTPGGPARLDTSRTSGGGYFPANGAGYDGYGSSTSSPVTGYVNGYDSPTAAPSSVPFAGFGTEQSSSYQRHSRTHSNASETSLNIDTGLGGEGGGSQYSASISSASSSRRNSVSERGGFFSRKAKTFRPGLHQDADDFYNGEAHGDKEDDGNLSSSSMGSNASLSSTTRNKLLRQRGGKGGKESGKRGVTDLFNDWDALLPSADPYDDGEEDDEGLNEDEKWKRRQLVKRGWESSRGQGIILGLLVIVSVLVRVWKLAVPAAVVFDEQHFAGFAADYLRGEFFMDVHPPLGKMLFAAVAYMLGFDGKFSFMLGKLYTKNVPYIGMRMFAVACGVGLVPISYLTIKKSGHSTQAAIICALLVTFENALITQSRFILLDAPMMLFMGYTLLAWINFYNHRNRPFTRGWTLWLLQTGFGLFLSSSVKWVGLFTIATVGACVIKYLQEARTHLYISNRNFSKQFIALFVCLLVLPAVMYVGLHVLDFKLLSNSGSGNAWVSPQFQMTLKGHDVQPVMADIAWESKIHIRHANTNGGWVHSMPGEYARENTADQAIQLVEWDDDLTCWQVQAVDLLLRERHSLQKQERKRDKSAAFDGYVYDGDEIRLRHCYSKVALAAKDVPSLGSNKTFLKEVRGTKWLKQPSPDMIWRVELVQEGLIPGLADSHGVKAGSKDNHENGREVKEPEKGSKADEMLAAAAKDATVDPKDPKEKLSRDSGKQWHSIKGFRLWNEKQQCYLQSHKVFRAPYSTYQEVGCIQGGRQKVNTIFIVDQNVNPHLPDSTPSLSYKPLSFFQKFLELNRVMWWTHHDLSAPVNGDDHYNGQAKSSDESGPLSWPFLRRGLNYYSSKETNHYVHFMGNPALWWAASTMVLVYMSSCLWSTFKFIKGKSESKVERDRFGITPFHAVASGTFFAGWAIHYIPFFFMHRQLYLHHYLPAFYFSILLLVSRLDRTWQRWPAKARYTAGLVLVAVAILSWFSFAPFAYGTDFGSKSQCERLRGLGGWKFTCQRQDLAWARPRMQQDDVVPSSKNRGVGDEDEDEEEDGGNFVAGKTQGDGDGSHHEAQEQQHQQEPEGVVEEEEYHAPEEHAQAPPPPPPKPQRPPLSDDERKIKVMIAAAEARAKEVLEKQALVAEKEALEVKHRELEERLLRQEQELEKQRALKEELAQQQRQVQEQEEQKRQAEAAAAAAEEEERQRIKREVEAVAAKLQEQQQRREPTREELEEQLRILQAQLKNGS